MRLHAFVRWAGQSGHRSTFTLSTQVYRIIAFFSSDIEPAKRERHLCLAEFGGNASYLLMLPFEETGSGETTLVLMPFLGGSQREWTETIAALERTYRSISIDLPGFGAAAAISGYSVSEMCDALIVQLMQLQLGRYILVGHSMAGKVSAVTTRRLMAAGSSLAPPNGLVLVAPSPPSSEPMSDEKRNEMLASLGNDSQLQRGHYLESDRHAAEKFVKDNVAQPLPEVPFERTVDEVLVMNPAAFVAWLEGGSKEDWSSFVGVLDLPTLIVAGTRDKSLGPDAQRKHTLPHFSHAELVEFDCSHLIPLESPKELASAISKFAGKIEEGIGGGYA